MQISNLIKYTLAIFLSAILVTVLVSCDKLPPASSSYHLVVVSYGGGAWEDAHKKAFYEPFTHISGVPIESVVWNAEYGKLKTDVDAQNVKWDVVEVTAAQYVRGKQENLYEPIALQLNTNQFIQGAIDANGIANVYWSTVFAYLPGQFQDNPHASWADFWNIQKYPGPRALYDDPRGNLEFALLADGVKASELYPLNVDRAFASLDKIKPYIRVWWTDGSQPIQLLNTKQVVLSSAWNGRIFAAKRDNSQVEWSWNGAAHDLDYWVIPKGSKNKATAERFLWFASQPYTMAAQTELVGYGPANIKALDFVPEEIRKQLPTVPTNFEQGFLVNSQWWSDNEDAIMKRWIEWKSK